MLDFENRCEPAPLRRREVRRLARTGSPVTCDEGKTGSFLEGSDLNEDVTDSKLLSNDYIITTNNRLYINLRFLLFLWLLGMSFATNGSICSETPFLSW